MFTSDLVKTEQVQEKMELKDAKTCLCDVRVFIPHEEMEEKEAVCAAFKDCVFKKEKV